jgi:nitrite reductase (NO-forming)
VEPEEGLPPVDREFYVMQSEFYTTGDTGEQGHQQHSTAKAEAEEPTYVVFNGRVGSLTGDNALETEVGETVRIFVGNAGVNLVSSFHVIGEIFDRVYIQASIASDPLESVLTTLLLVGGAAVVEFKVDVPGDYILVDHSLYRMDKGALGILVATGPEDPDTYSPVE